MCQLNTVGKLSVFNINIAFISVTMQIPNCNINDP